jgi:hypothetical protein
MARNTSHHEGGPAAKKTCNATENATNPPRDKK